MAICTREHSAANFLKNTSSGFRTLASLSVPQTDALSRGLTRPTPGRMTTSQLATQASIFCHAAEGITAAVSRARCHPALALFTQLIRAGQSIFFAQLAPLQSCSFCIA